MMLFEHHWFKKLKSRLDRCSSLILVMKLLF